MYLEEVKQPCWGMCKSPMEKLSWEPPGCDGAGGALGWAYWAGNGCCVGAGGAQVPFPARAAKFREKPCIRAVCPKIGRETNAGYA